MSVDVWSPGYQRLPRQLACWSIVLALVACSDGPDTSEEQFAPEVAEWVRPAVEIPSGAVVVDPGDDIQAALDEAGPEGTVLLLEGIHRTGGLRPRTGQVIVGEDGAVLSGAEPIGPFEQRAVDRWVARAPGLVTNEKGRCRREYPLCSEPQDLIVGGRVIRRVASEQALDEASWYFDTADRSIWLGFNPTGADVELSMRSTAFEGEAPNVTIRGLTIEGYASPAQQGAIRGRSGWQIIGNEIRSNHAVGIKTAGGMVVDQNYIHHNGQFAMSGGGVNMRIEQNEMSHNGVAGYSPFWGAGGAKFVATKSIVVRSNLVYANFGPGLWTDGAGDDTLYEANRVFDNAHAGIKHEISGSVKVIRNDVRGNGFDHSYPPKGAGILIRESGPAELIENIVDQNADQVILLQQDDRKNDNNHRLMDITVTGNTIGVGNGQVGFLGDLDERFVAEFVDNTYIGNTDRRAFIAFGQDLSWHEWVEQGYETSSILLTPDGTSAGAVLAD